MMQQFQGRCDLPALTISTLFLKTRSESQNLYLIKSHSTALTLSKTNSKISGYALKKIFFFFFKSEYVKNLFPPSCNECMLHIPVRPIHYQTNTNANWRK